MAGFNQRAQVDVSSIIESSRILEPLRMGALEEPIILVCDPFSLAWSSFGSGLRQRLHGPFLEAKWHVWSSLPCAICYHTSILVIIPVDAFLLPSGLQAYKILLCFKAHCSSTLVVVPHALVLQVILAGAALCGIIVNALRMRAGLKLKDVGFQEQTELIQRVQEAKVLGQRGAYPSFIVNRKHLANIPCCWLPLCCLLKLLMDTAWMPGWWSPLIGA